jgi:hypothetical protein
MSIYTIKYVEEAGVKGQWLSEVPCRKLTKSTTNVFLWIRWSNTSNRGVVIHDVQVQKEQHDPPDFLVRIDGNQFAVEETSIVVQRTVTQNPAGSKWEGEAQHELAGLIQNAVSQKRSKLEKSGVPQQCRDIILLLYDAYMCGSTEDAKLALQNVHGYDWFHSVFWAASFADRPNELYPQEPGRLGLFLYTKEDRWDR